MITLTSKEREQLIALGVITPAAQKPVKKWAKQFRGPRTANTCRHPTCKRDKAPGFKHCDRHLEYKRQRKAARREAGYRCMELRPDEVELILRRREMRGLA